MEIIQSTFNSASELYLRWFQDWLHVHFLIRTVILLLIMWLMIYLATQLFQYIIAPIFVLFYYHVIFRVWNFIAIETTQEIIYIRYYSKDKPNFNDLYHRLCDRSKSNRLTLEYTSYTGIIKRGKVRRVSIQAMVILLVASTLWVGAFGLYKEYVTPVIVIVENNNEEISKEPQYENNEADSPTHEFRLWPATDSPPVQTTYIPNFGHVHSWETQDEYFINPRDWQNNTTVHLFLNEQGREGTRLRDGAGISNTTVIEILWEYEALEYLHDYVPDPDISGLYWLSVKSPNGTEGFISSRFIEGLWLVPSEEMLSGWMIPSD